MSVAGSPTDDRDDRRPGQARNGGWGTADWAAKVVGRPYAGKTGTTDDARSAWFIGFTPQLTGAAFVADPDNPFDIAGEWQYKKPSTAVTMTIRDAMQGQPVRGFTAPPANLVARAAATARPHR